MSKVSHQKERYGVGNELLGDNGNEGTAARTRPFSFQEIMLGRKKKKLNGEIAAYSETLSVKDKDARGSNSSDGVCIRKKNSAAITKHSSVATMEGSSRQKEEITTLKEQSFTKGKGKDIRESEANLKNTLDKNRNTTTKDINKSEKQSHHRDRNKEHPTAEFESEYKKKPLDDSAGKEKYQDTSREKSELESKRKHQSKDRDKKKHRLDKDERTVKSHDSSKKYTLESAEKDKKKVTSFSHYEEARPKRRRSRSHEPRDRDKRSISLSPRSHKRAYRNWEHGNSSSHSSKERRQHSDADKKRMSSNGGYGGSHHRHHGGHGSRLGGYSPRKRRTEAAARTPSPTPRSPDRKSAGWDLPPPGIDIISSASMTSIFQSSHQVAVSVTHEISAAATVPPNVPKPSGLSPHIPSITKDVSIDSIQLTQATRPMRRVYVENLPISASDKSLMECLNDFLLSSGTNCIQGTHPCISCIVNKEKGQAVLEFLTPEDATAALSFDGRSFSGSVLKVRRPKDFVETATGVLEKPVVTTDAISKTVKDSPHKIFIGGISKVLSSDMLMEIASAFGPLQAYCFQFNRELDEPVAFLEYVDRSNTNKACAGLNGMKLGGKILTAVLAFPCASLEENLEKPPFYGIPEHAKPLLLKPTKVLKLKNVINEVELSSLAGSELEEILEDIRLECMRFGTVKSINISRDNTCLAVAPELVDVSEKTDLSVLQDQERESTKRMKTNEDDIDTNCGGSSRPDGSKDDIETLERVDCFTENGANDDEPDHDLAKDQISEPSQLETHTGSEATSQLDAHADLVEEPSTKVDTECQESATQLDGISQESFMLLDSSKDQFTMPSHLLQSEESNIRNGLVLEDGLKEADAVEKKTNVGEDSIPKHPVSYSHDFFEPGCILVEYARSEAACTAAHCLHGRLYGDNIVEVSYVSHDAYLSKFPR